MIVRPHAGERPSRSIYTIRGTFTIERINQLI